jgi:2'-5' RNA ligase
VTPEKLRLFVAAVLPSEQLEVVAALVRRLQPELERARWTAAANQHVTLKFLGWTGADRLEDISERVTAVARAHAPADLELGPLGAFPSRRRARVLWLGLDDPQRLLESLASALDSALAPVGFKPEKRAFTPHVTLARFKPPESVERVTAEPVAVEARRFPVDRLVLFRSHPHSSGVRYEELVAVALRDEV